jgi:hypothetical protein
MFPPNSTRDNAASSLSSGCCHRSRYTFWHTSQASRSPHRATDGPRARRRARTGTRPAGRSQASRTAPAGAVPGSGCRTTVIAGCTVPCRQDDPATLWNLRRRQKIPVDCARQVCRRVLGQSPLLRKGSDPDLDGCGVGSLCAARALTRPRCLRTPSRY